MTETVQRGRTMNCLEYLYIQKLIRKKMCRKIQYKFTY